MKTADAISEILRREGIEWVIGYPVNHILERAAAANVRPIIVRQERTGLHMAEAISRVTSGQKLGVFAMQHGPGTENAYGGVAQAYSESVPILVMPMGYQRRAAWVGRHYHASVSMASVTKSAEPVTSAKEIPAIFRRAFTQLRSGRGGPVLVEIPVDVWNEEIDAIDYAAARTLRWGPDPDAVREATAILLKAKRPVLYVGQGVHWAQAWSEVAELAELLAIPVCTSLQGKSAFPETHPLSLGSGGLATTGTVNHFLKEADLIFGIGCSFSETNFGVKMPPGKTIIHATLDPADVNKDVRSALAVLGDAKLVLAAVIEEAGRQGAKSPKDPQRVAAEIKEVYDGWLKKWLPKLTFNEAPLSPYRVLWDLQNTVDVANTIITHDAGSPHTRPRSASSHAKRCHASGRRCRSSLATPMLGAGAEAAPPAAGDCWTWTAICADTKLVPSWLVGPRDGYAAKQFIADLATRLAHRVQLTSDGHRAYLDAVETVFGEDIDYAQLVKLYGETEESEKRYSPPKCTGCERHIVTGQPDERHISTSFAERNNLTMRMHMRRFTRLTNAFSKKVENHAHAVALHFMYYNFCKLHKAHRLTPAMAAGVTERLWEVSDIVDVLEAWERQQEYKRVTG